MSKADQYIKAQGEMEQLLKRATSESMRLLIQSDITLLGKVVRDIRELEKQNDAR